MIQHRVVRGLHVVLDVEVGIGGLVLDWAYLDPEEKALALRFDGVREDVDDGTLDEAGNAVLDALRPWMY